MSKAYTLEELLIITVAKEIRDYENVVLGVGLPTTAGALAKAIYAPHATLIMESGIIDFEPLLPLNHIADANALRGFAYANGPVFRFHHDLSGICGCLLPRRGPG